MKPRFLRCLFADTLAKRLFLLMWFALIASHFAAYLVASPRPLFDHKGEMQLPTLPSLPPTPGLSPPRPKPAPPGARSAPPPGPGPGPHRAPDRGGPPALPMPALILDYGVRLLLIALASWFGARWLSRPVRQFSAAARDLSNSIDATETTERLDASRGTVEIREATQAFNDMADQLEKQFQSRGLLIASISHDLRTPLTRIRMRLEKCTDEALARQCISDIREMNQLIETVFEIFDSSQDQQANEKTDIFALVQAVVDDMNQIDPKITLDGDKAIAPANPVSLRRALQNLLGNALRYAGQATVVVSSTPDEVSIRIDDNGPGIPEKLLNAVFEPFYRVETSRNRASGGAGLGLYITRELIEKQGGRISLRNRDEGGLSAVIRLPY